MYKSNNLIYIFSFIEVKNITDYKLKIIISFDHYDDMNNLK